jgi:hypothetical protein
MATYEITSPDGAKYRITAPEGATQDDALKYVQQHHSELQALPVTPGGQGDIPNPQQPATTPSPRPTLTQRVTAPFASAIDGPDSVSMQAKRYFSQSSSPALNYMNQAIVGPAATALIDLPTAVMRSAAGGVAGVAEALGLSPSSSDRLERDLNVLGETATLETGRGASAERGVMAPASEVGNAARTAAKETYWTDPNKAVVTQPGLGPQLAAGKVQQRLDAQRVAPEKAASLIEKRLADEMKASGKSPQEIAGEIQRLRGTGKPISLLDIATPQGPLEGLAGAVARKGGPSSGVINRYFDKQDLEAGPRLAKDVNSSLGYGSSYYAARDLEQVQKAASKPAYDAAYAHPPINPDEMAPTGRIGALMDRPSMRDGMANARKIAAEEGVDINTLGIDVDAEGVPFYTSVPTWKTLDYVKRGVQGVVESHRDSITGKLDTYGRAAAITLSHFSDAFADLNPKYKAALDAYSGPQTSIDALRQGEKFLTMRPEKIQDILDKYGQGDREFFKLGAADTIRTALEKKGVGGDEAKAVLKSQHMRNQLRPLFDSDDDFNKFVENVEIESGKFARKVRVTGGSQSAQRLNADSNLADETAAHATHAAASLLSHNPISAAKHGLRAYQNWRATGDEEVNDYIARALTDLGLIPQISGDSIKLPPLGPTQ